MKLAKFIPLLFIVFSFNTFAVDCEDLNYELKKRGEFLASSKNCIKLPLMKSGYVPQGIHVTVKKKTFVSMYHKSPKNGKSYKNSVIVEIDNKTKKHIKTYKLPNKSHVGGIAIFDKYSKFVYPSGLRFCIAKKSSKLRVNCQRQSIGSSKRTEKFSFIDYGRDHKGQYIMWAGQFKVGKAAKKGMHIFGYKVSKGRISTKPSYRFYVPPEIDKVQGISVIPSYKNYKILVSRSYGNRNSVVTLLNYKRENKYFYKYKYKSSKKVYQAPPGLEELDIRKNGVWTLLESGAQYYDKKWSGVGLPFIFRIPKSHLGL